MCVSCCRPTSRSLGHRQRAAAFVIGLAEFTVGVLGFLCGAIFTTFKSESATDFIAEAVAIMFVEQFDEVAFRVIRHCAPRWHRAQVEKLEKL